MFVTLENFMWPWDLQCKWIHSPGVGLSIAKFVSLRGTEIWTSPFFAKTWPLFTGVNKNVETVLGEVEKSGFYCFAQQRGPQWANAPKTVWPTLEQVVSFTVFREQAVVSSWTILGLVGFKLKFHALSASWFQPVSGQCSCGQQCSSRGLLPVKTT